MLGLKWVSGFPTRGGGGGGVGGPFKISLAKVASDKPASLKLYLK